MLHTMHMISIFPSTMTSSSDEEAIQLLLSRIETIEKSWWTATTKRKQRQQHQTQHNKDEVVATIITPEMRRARRHTEKSHCYSSQWKLCPSNYYTLSLDERKVILGADNICQLCKACLFENKNYKPTAASSDGDTDENGKGNNNDPTNSQYYLVVVQYVESINTKTLASELRGLRPAGPTRLDPNYFSDLRLAPEDVSERLTGYGHNGVCPFGLLDSTIPIIVCKRIVENMRPRFMWMGGGDKDWKLGMAVTECVSALNAIVLDVSEPRIVLSIGGTNCNTVV